MHERGVDISHETVRYLVAPVRTNVCRRDPLAGWRDAIEPVAIALDEMFVTINGETHYLWRAVDNAIARP